MKHEIKRPIFIVGDRDGAESFAVDFALRNNLPHVMLRLPRKGGIEARDWIAVQACDLAIGFSDTEETGNTPILQLLKVAAKSTEYYVLGENGFEIKPWIKKRMIKNK